MAVNSNQAVTNALDYLVKTGDASKIERAMLQDLQPWEALWGTVDDRAKQVLANTWWIARSQQSAQCSGQPNILAKTVYWFIEATFERCWMKKTIPYVDIATVDKDGLWSNHEFGCELWDALSDKPGDIISSGSAQLRWLWTKESVSSLDEVDANLPNGPAGSILNAALLCDLAFRTDLVDLRKYAVRKVDEIFPDSVELLKTLPTQAQDYFYFLSFLNGGHFDGTSVPPEKLEILRSMHREKPLDCVRVWDYCFNRNTITWDSPVKAWSDGILLVPESKTNLQFRDLLRMYFEPFSKQLNILESMGASPMEALSSLQFTHAYGSSTEGTKVLSDINFDTQVF